MPGTKTVTIDERVRCLPLRYQERYQRDGNLRSFVAANLSQNQKVRKKLNDAAADSERSKKAMVELLDLYIGQPLLK